MGAQGSLSSALNKAKWQICEPVMEVDLMCTKAYFERSCFLKGIENLDIMYENETCFLKFKSKITGIVGCIDEFYNNKEVLEFNMKLNSYITAENGVDFNNKFRMICDLAELTD